jgi:uncharacterized protein YqeY
MKISELIKEVTKDYMPLYKEVKRKQKEGIEVTEEELQNLFELSTKLELFKILKSSFMETIVKDENGKVTEYFVKNKLITFHKEIAKDKNDNEVEVDVVNESMDVRIDMLPNEFTQPLIEKMVTAHNKNIEGYTNSGNNELLKKEQYELEVLNTFLPKEATQEDVMEYLNEYYPNGIEKKSMGLVIKEVKGAFDRVDGKMVAQCVNTKIVN